MKVFITGSSDGLGKLAAIKLVEHRHQVVLHARNPEKGREALNNVPNAEGVLNADLSSIDETKKLAAEVNALGAFDAIIHNAGVYQASKESILKVNCIAPYILTSLIQRPKRLIYISSGLHLGGRTNLKDLSEGVSYSDSKLLLLLLSMAVTRKWPDVYSNAVNPGWVPTKMGGSNAPDNLLKGVESQVWLAVSNDKEAKVSGRYFFHQNQTQYHPDAADPIKQDKFLELGEQISGVPFPE